MKEFLESYPELGAVSLWFGNGKKVKAWLNHISIQCSLFRRDVFAGLDFTKHINRGCTCENVKQQIEKTGLKIRYLDFEKRGYEIEYK
jgi:hypothetical protein